MPDSKLVPTSYKRLVTDISSLYEGARKALVTAYWRIGQRIVEVEQDGAVKAAYGANLLANLSADLSKGSGPGFSERNLERMRAFYLTHPKSTAPSKLTWSQYAELIPVKNSAVRKQLEERALTEGLTHKMLRRLVHAELVREQVAEKLSFRHARGDLESPSSQAENPIELLTPVRGTLYAYRIAQPKIVGEGESQLLIDLGFSSYKDVDTVTSRGLKVGDIVISQKMSDDQYRLVKTNPESRGTSPAALYTYNAEVEKVVDGDTLRVVVDLGFGFKTRQYLRLRGLDCPEMDTPEGKKAAEFVRSRIRVASEIILTSSKSDKYDRYLADVYFTDNLGKEQYLNNLLLEQGLAVKMGA